MNKMVMMNSTVKSLSALALLVVVAASPDFDASAFAAAFASMNNDTTTTTTATTSTSSRAAEWGTMATVTTSATTTAASPSTSPTPKRLPQKGDILSLCQPSLLSTFTFDTDTSMTLNKREFTNFIEANAGQSGATVILSSASDSLYAQLRTACAAVFQMPSTCYDDTVTTDDDTTNPDMGKLDKFEIDVSNVYDGVLLIGFDKAWKDKNKEERKYEEFFCSTLINFYVMNDVVLDWAVVDGDGGGAGVTAVNTTVNAQPGAGDAATTVAAVEDGGSGTVTASSATVDASVADLVITSQETTAMTTTTEATLSSSSVVTTANTEEVTTTTVASNTTDPEEVILTTVATAEEQGEEEQQQESQGQGNSSNTASEINTADTSFVQSNTIDQQQQKSSYNSWTNKIPVGGWIGIALGGFLLVFFLAGLIVSTRRRRRRNSRNNSPNNGRTQQVNCDENWWDEENNMNSGAAGVSSVAALGMASTVATRLTTGDTEVTLMEKQLWTKKEPVV